MGDFQAALPGQADNAALQQAKALGARGLLTGFKEDLQPQANAQKGPAGVHKIVDGLLQAPGPELVHGIAKGTHPWQHRGVGGQQAAGSAVTWQSQPMWRRAFSTLWRRAISESMMEIIRFTSLSQ